MAGRAGGSRRGENHTSPATLVFSARFGPDLLFRFLFFYLPAQRIDWPERDFAGQSIPAGSKAILSGNQRDLVCAHSPVVWVERPRFDDRVLAGNRSFNGRDFQSVAANQLASFAAMFSFPGRGGAGLLLLSIRRHAAGSRVHLVVFCSSRPAAGARRHASSQQGQPVSAPVGVVPNLL